MRLVYPERLGLVGITGSEPLPSDGELDGSKIIEAVRSGHANAVTSILTSSFLQGNTVADLWDGPVASALEFFGEFWRTDESGVGLEHETTMAIVDAMVRIKGLLPQPTAGAPKALGGSPSGDPYLLANLAAAAVLRESRFTVFNLGPDTPLPSFLEAAERHRPDLFWLSLTTKRSDKEVAQIDEFIETLRGLVGQIVLGGRFALANRLRWTDQARVLGTMNDLGLVADTIRAGR